MTYDKMRKQLFEVNEIVIDNLYGSCVVVKVEYDNQLNFMTYTIRTEFGEKARTNNTLTH